jgi:flagellar biosynthesis protein
VPDTQAVALEYDPAQGQLPHVVAAGKGFVAEQILALAFANGVKVRQDADLVQILGAIDLDSDIPPEAFAAVAEILAYLYKANQSASSWFDELYAPSDKASASSNP